MGEDDDGFYTGGLDDLDEAATMASWGPLTSPAAGGALGRSANNLLALPPQASNEAPFSPRAPGGGQGGILSARSLALLQIEGPKSGLPPHKRLWAWFVARPLVQRVKRLGSRIKAGAKTIYSTVNIFVGGPPPWQDAFQALFFDVSIASGMDGSQVKIPADLDKLIVSAHGQSNPSQSAKRPLASQQHVLPAATLDEILLRLRRLVVCADQLEMSFCAASLFASGWADGWPRLGEGRPGFHPQNCAGPQLEPQEQQHDWRRARERRPDPVSDPAADAEEPRFRKVRRRRL